jgi:hypothetical protein
MQKDSPFVFSNGEIGRLNVKYIEIGRYNRVFEEKKPRKYDLFEMKNIYLHKFI